MGFSNIDSNFVCKINTHGIILFFEALVYPIFKHLHKDIQYGTDALMDPIRPHLKGPHLQRTKRRMRPSSSYLSKITGVQSFEGGNCYGNTVRATESPPIVQDVS